ncbi:hypothetical protein FRB95_005397 [Tulasnella sp. JGI-2019a]|nr:hypothetical protein FRB95_005397 [Tulasnella sp. JGI-2019a]
MRTALSNTIQRYNSHDSTRSSRLEAPPADMGWRDIASGVAKAVTRTAVDGYGRVSSAVQTRHDPGGICDNDTWNGWWERRSEEIKGAEKVALYPGFAVRRYRDKGIFAGGSQSQGPFSVEIFVDGSATSLRPPELATRPQKAFLRLAKGFAALPKLPPSHLNGGSALDSISLKGDDNDEDFANDMRDAPDFHGFTINDLPSDGASIHTVDSVRSSLGSLKDMPTEELARYHANLDRRLQPFWSRNLANRTVRLSVFVHSSNATETLDLEQIGPLVTRTIRTDAQGYFDNRFRIDYETLCRYPGTAGLVSGAQDPLVEHNLVVRADLLPADGVLQNMASGTRATPSEDPSSEPSGPVSTEARIPLTTAKVRLISDIDDTVKRLDFIHGAKAIFRNTFVHPLEDLIVPGMAEWYQRMGKKGVQFHFVSNSPFEMAAPIQEFFKIASFPYAHIKLKAWGGARSMIGGLWEDAATRKRGRVLEVLDDFKESQFFLVGDSGEQDLELYATIAQARPDQILGVFIRDVTSSSFLPILGIDDSGDYQSSFGSITSETPQPWTTEFSDPDVDSLPNQWDALRISTDHQARTPTGTPATARPLSYVSGPNAASPVPPPRPPPLPPRHSSQGSSNGPGTPPPPPPRPSSQALGTPNYPPPPPPRPLYKPSGSLNHDYLQQQVTTVDSPQPMSTPLHVDAARPRPPQHQSSSTGPLPPGSYFPPKPPARPYSVMSSSGSGFRKGSKGEDPERVAAEKKRDEFRIRIQAARAIVPKHIVLRVFKEPEECLEATEILDRLNAQQASGEATW